jgi:hypothetical protein
VSLWEPDESTLLPVEHITRCVGYSPDRSTTKTKSVRGLRRVDLADPGRHTATDMHRVGKPGSMD